MRTPPRVGLLRLIASVVLLLVVGAAGAAHVSPQGTGQVLLYPYYTTRGYDQGLPYNSLLIVTNTASDTKVVRVVFRESLNGRPAGRERQCLSRSLRFVGGGGCADEQRTQHHHPRHILH